MKRAESHCPTHMNWYSDCKSRLEEKENKHDLGPGGGGTGIGRQSTLKKLLLECKVQVGG